MNRQIYAHQDDRSDLTDDDLADKVMRYIRYAALIDTSELSVIVLGRTVVLSGYVLSETEIGCVEDAAASVIGVHLVENQVKARVH